MEQISRDRTILWIILGFFTLAAIAFIIWGKSLRQPAEQGALPAGSAATPNGMSAAPVDNRTTPTDDRMAADSAQPSPRATDTMGEQERTPPTAEYRIVTLLPRDAIPSIDSPRFYSIVEADAEYDPDELVLGVTINGESKAYSSSFLDSHEIVNDTLGGRPISVTW